MSEHRTLTCHCGAVEVEVELDNGFENKRRCDCSLSKRNGAIMTVVPIN